MSTFTAKKFSAILGMAAFSGTTVSLSVSGSEKTHLRFDTIFTDFTDENILINQPIDMTASDLRKLLYKRISVRMPHEGGVCEWTVTATRIIQQDRGATLVCSNPGKCSYINHRHHQRITLSTPQRSYQAVIKEVSRQKRTISCEAVFDISKIAAAVKVATSDTSFISEGTDATFILKHADKKVFQASVTHTVFHRNQGSSDTSRREIVFFKPAIIKRTYKRRIRRITPPETLPVFIKARHPLIPDETVTGRMQNFSKTGLSFRVEGHSVSLFPGLVLNGITFFFPFNKPLKASATIIHCTPVTIDDEQCTHIGLAVHHISEQLASVSDALYLRDIDTSLTDATPSDMRDIFRHLFSSNFIYHQKRRFLQHNVTTVKSTQYRLLKPNTISKTVIAKYDDSIRGFIQYIKFHRHTWLVQHLAGGSGYTLETGKLVLKATIDFFLYPEINLMRKIHYISCYYRPQNPFPMLLFNGFTTHIARPSISQSITYTYCTVDPSAKVTSAVDNYRCASASPSDLFNLESFIKKKYGTVYKHVEALSVKELTSDTLSGEYERYGLLRKRQVICLKKNDDTLLAFSVCDFSSPGINLSELTNSFKMYTVAEDAPDMNDALTVLAAATINEYKKIGISGPVLLSPPTAAIPAPFTGTKQYIFWFIDAAYINKWNSYFNMITGNFKKHLRDFKKSMTIRNKTLIS